MTAIGEATPVPEFVATGNPGCLMQIGAGLRVAGFATRAVHPVELLDWSYRRAGLYDSEGSQSARQPVGQMSGGDR